MYLTLYIVFPSISLRKINHSKKINLIARIGLRNFYLIPLYSSIFLFYCQSNFEIDSNFRQLQRRLGDIKTGIISLNFGILLKWGISIIWILKLALRLFSLKDLEEIYIFLNLDLSKYILNHCNLLKCHFDENHHNYKSRIFFRLFAFVTPV